MNFTTLLTTIATLAMLLLTGYIGGKTKIIVDGGIRTGADILKALASYIHLSGMIQPAEYTELQRLEIYLDRHYTEKLSLATISAELNISRTKLCSMAKRLSGGKTLLHFFNTGNTPQKG